MRQLLATVRDEAAQRREVLTMEGDLAQRLEFCGMVGRGPAMQEVFGLIRRLAPHVRTALISGETGTGEELVARALHKLGPRSTKRFVTVNCSAGRQTPVQTQRFSKALVGLTPGAERLLSDAMWDGNVRQLRNVIERACILAEGDFVGEGDLSGSMQEQRLVPAASTASGMVRGGAAPNDSNPA